MKKHLIKKYRVNVTWNVLEEPRSGWYVMSTAYNNVNEAGEMYCEHFVASQTEWICKY